MDDVNALAARMLERGQSGEAATIIVESERVLRERTGDLLDGPAAIHFARAVAIDASGDHRAALAAGELMLVAAEREGDPGWVSCAYSLNAHIRLSLGESDVAEHDLGTVLRELVHAENALKLGVEDPWLASNAHTGIALPYNDLRLYELALPHYRAAYEVSLQSEVNSDAPTMWLLNLTYMYLDWALELYRIGQVEAAEKKSREAESYAVRARETASGPEGPRWARIGGLLAACARTSMGEAQPALDDIESFLSNDSALLEHGAWAAPFQAVALKRNGRTAEALELLNRTLSEATEQTGWMDLAALQHTRAQLLVERGSVEARMVLDYGQTLAEALWRQRLRTLHVATTMRSYDSLRAEHEVVAHSAATDPLTGIANRRAFDAELTRLRDGADPQRPVVVVMIDLDKFKQINDSQGHDAGDQVLVKVAAALTANLRDGDLVARLGGDEFGVLLPDAELEPGMRAAWRMVTAVDEIADSTVTASIGVAAGPARLVQDTLVNADRAMYAAKRAGGNRVSASS